MDDELERAYARWNNAWLTKDAAAVADIAAADYAYIGPFGQVLDKDDILEIVHAPSYQLVSGSWTGTAFDRLAADAALVLDRFRGKGEYRGQVFAEDHRCSAVWVRRHGQWQIRLEHCSAIANG
jgi:ketosteroid isomerase-like protein